MQTVIATHPSVEKRAWLMLGSRLVLFLLFQSLMAGFLNSWEASQKYWLLAATLTNFVSIIWLFYSFKKENLHFFAIFRFNKDSLKRDIIVFLFLCPLIAVTVVFPGQFLSLWLWGDTSAPIQSMFQPIDQWLAYGMLLVFPLSIAFAELPVYFGFIMPRLEKQLQSKWAAIAVPALFLSLQHSTLPFIPDWKFIVYRGLVFLPFALLIGIAIRNRPSLFPYFIILHAILDFGTAMMFIQF